MDIRIEQRALSKLLARTVPATAAKSPMAMLTHVLLTADKNGQVTVKGTDLTLSLTAADQAEVKTPGALAVSARQLSDIVRLLKPGELRLVAKSGRLEIVAGKSRSKVPYLEPDDFPKIPEPAPAAARLRMPSRELARMLGQTMYARSHDEGRAFLACVRLEQSANAVRCVAMDSKRLALASSTLERADDWGGEQINARALDSVKSLCEAFDEEPVAVSTHGGLDGYMHFEWPGVTLAAKSAGSNFISYAKLLPPTFSRVASAGREEALDALKRVALVAGKVDWKATCALTNGKLTISCQSGSEEIVEELDVDFAGKSLEFGMNAQCLIDALKTMTDDSVLIQLNGVKDPLVIVGEHDKACTALIVPMLLGGAA